ncbi:MAG: SDR family oxidoreductase [Alphaproteobacteria bacterium]|nr:SDR family oxidoreductase [Alphaproteobacteria bacterium]
MPDLDRLFAMEGRTALVTGASSGLGRYFAGVLHEAGARVVLAARRRDRIEAEAARLGERAHAVAMDVADEASVLAAFDRIGELAGVCDVLINNAGTAAPRPALDITAAEWDAVLDVNLRGAFLVAREAARRLVAAGRPGSIVNIASILAERVTGGVASYTASKAGLLQLTRSLALELARHRIRVNALAPGYIATEINVGFFDTEAGKAMIRRIPQRRLGEFSDLAGPLLLLASDAGAHMTGAAITVDGGHAINSL